VITLTSTKNNITRGYTPVANIPIYLVSKITHARKKKDLNQ